MPVFSKAFAVTIGIDVTKLTPTQSFLTVRGALKNPIGVINELVFTLF